MAPGKNKPGQFRPRTRRERFRNNATRRRDVAPHVKTASSEAQAEVSEPIHRQTLLSCAEPAKRLSPDAVSFRAR